MHCNVIAVVVQIMRALLLLLKFEGSSPELPLLDTKNILLTGGWEDY